VYRLAVPSQQLHLDAIKRPSVESVLEDIQRELGVGMEPRERDLEKLVRIPVPEDAREGGVGEDRPALSGDGAEPHRHGLRHQAG
jgi:hypothetical protein